jgi:hypothetical protein
LKSNSCGEHVQDRPNKQSRKDKLHQWRAQQRAAARAKLPLPDEQMQAMFDMLDSALPNRGCDHTLRLVREWSVEHGLAFDAVAAWCHENGGHCDCEVLSNCEERWQDAKHDVNW